MDDLISRQAAIAAIQNLYPGMPRVNVCDSMYKWREKNKAYIECEEIIKKLPSLKPKKGVWMNSGIGTICSNCHYKLETTGWLSKCPHCGAEMEVI